MNILVLREKAEARKLRCFIKMNESCGYCDPIKKATTKWEVTLQGGSLSGTPLGRRNMGPETETPWREHGTRDRDPLEGTWEQTGR